MEHYAKAQRNSDVIEECQKGIANHNFMAFGIRGVTKIHSTASEDYQNRESALCVGQPSVYNA